jgi:undecaprenyl phosphate-alpha-L-ara4FN deformylase
LKLALKIDADTYRGTREGVPRLIEILRRHDAGATFFFSLGPDHTGLYGKALPAPEIGRRCADVMRGARDAGFEIGLQAWNCVQWRRAAPAADAEWTARHMALAISRYEDIFGEQASVHGAAGWRMNRHAFRNTQSLGFDYASDTRGTHPFVPVVRAEIIACPQVPTTLPTLEEFIGREAMTADKAVEKLLAATAPAPNGAPAALHVFTLRAIEGLRLAATVEALLTGWKSQGRELVALRDLIREVGANGLPMHRIVEGPIALQGPEFLAEAASPTPGC